jgi:hypothetical protein
MGGLYQFVAHPPGFSGFCTFGHAVNALFHNINASFVWISVCSALVGTLATFRLSMAIDGRRRPAVAAAAAFSLSLCVLYFSVVALSYAIEGAFAAVIGWLAFEALDHQSPRRLRSFTAIWAAAGAFRPTTTAFLFPFWLWTCYRTRKKVSDIGRQALIAIPIVALWFAANSWLLRARSGFAVSATDEFVSLQVLMPVQYDTTSLAVVQSESRPTRAYHWPWVEVAARVWTACGGRLPAGFPEPSLRRALALTMVQLGKLGFYLVLSAPALLLLLLPAARRRAFAHGRVALLPFFLFWMGPPLAFFLLGHFGSFGYLEVVLPACCVAAARGAGFEGTRTRPNLSRVGFTFLTACGISFFLFGRPIHSTSSAAKSANVIALQYTGSAVLAQYSVARSTINRPDPRQLDFVPPECNTDDCLLSVAERIHWSPNSYFKRPVAGVH